MVLPRDLSGPWMHNLQIGDMVLGQGEVPSMVAPATSSMKPLRPLCCALSGSLVIAETLGDKKASTVTSISTSTTSTTLAPPAASSLLLLLINLGKSQPLKRTSTSSNAGKNLITLPIYIIFPPQQHGITFGTIPQQQQNVHHHVSKDEAPDSRQTLPGDYVLQKRSPPTVQQESIKNERDDAVQEPMPLLALTEGDDTIGAAGAHASLETLDESKPQDVKAVIALDDGPFAGAVSEPDLFSPAKVQALASVDVPGPETGSMNFISPPTTAQESKSAEGVKVLKVPKRKREDGIPSGQIKKKKTKKKDSGIAAGPGPERRPKKPAGKVVGVSVGFGVPSRTETAQGDLHRKEVVGNTFIQLPKVDIGSMNIKLPQKRSRVLGQKPPERIRQEQETPTPVAPLVRAASKPPIARKEETLNHPKVVSPTYLVMKFPPKSTLPSVASMKAKFARFGTLEIDAIRCTGSRLTCKVLFKYRVDAVAAYSHCKSNQTYGPRVNYSIRDADSSVSETPDSAKRQETKAAGWNTIRDREWQCYCWHVSELLRPSLRPQTGQPNQFWKKPMMLVAPSRPAKETQRKSSSMLGGDDVRKEPPSVVASKQDWRH
ncbi:hypothetical protein J5N97_018214 [Dioscorea zingiberensis]|uniref:Uncharacterized protein n=1 Tax=Dioscorea zingiberensis TaxID=325984 RepID=A0A9D5HH39_9LILI|nr:hypothetical protein J5N97_018214 [Dioscorea zingiberensis]